MGILISSVGSLTDLIIRDASHLIMSLFNDLLRVLQLIDIPLKNRRFTWCSNRPAPTHSKIDRIFVAPEISIQFSLVSLNALQVLVSDHAPLLLNCINEPCPKRLYKLELFWFSNPHAISIIHENWNRDRLPLNSLQISVQIARRCIRDSEIGMFKTLMKLKKEGI